MHQGKVITIVAAMARNRAIGLNGDLPWHLPGELKHFKQATMGRAIVMGRKTWESIGRALPGRQNIVVTRNREFKADGCDIAASLDEAVQLARGPEVMIIGGGQLYELAMPFTDRMIVTLVDCEPEGDTWFPAWRNEEWDQLADRSEPAGERNRFAYQVLELIRKNGSCDTSRAPGTTAGPPA